MPPEPLLTISRLTTEVRTEQGTFHAVDGVSLELAVQGTLGIVGESGCGKSMLALSILGLLPDPPCRIVGGEIHFAGRDLRRLPEAEMRRLRGKEIGMVFQEPMSALNPVYSVGQQIVEALRLHEGLSRAQARARAIELLAQVGIPAPEQRVDAYPHELSGGMRQRVMIAIAVSCNPHLLIADEPTTALDVTIQAQVLQLLADLQAKLEMGIIVITHDLGVVAEFVDHVLVMYAGRAVEYGSVREIFERPLHPYTRGLLSSIPGNRVAVAMEGQGRRRLSTIPGVVPDLRNLGPGCRFRGRCPAAIAQCATVDPELVTLADGRKVACLVAMAGETRAAPERHDGMF